MGRDGYLTPDAQRVSLRLYLGYIPNAIFLYFGPGSQSPEITCME